MNKEFIFAIQKKDIETVSRLLEEGIDPNTKASDDTPVIIIASWYGCTEIASMLVDKGADVNYINKNGKWEKELLYP